MKMTCDGALIMPKNYAVMTEEEMCYTEGGGTFKKTLVFNTFDVYLTIDDVNSAFINLVSAWAGLYGVVASAIAAATGPLAVAAVASGIANYAGYLYNAQQLQSRITLTKKYHAPNNSHHRSI